MTNRTYTKLPEPIQAQYASALKGADGKIVDPESISSMGAIVAGTGLDSAVQKTTAEISQNLALNDYAIALGKAGVAGVASATAWSDTGSYALNDIVSYNGKYYTAITDTQTGDNPTIDTANWHIIEAPVAIGVNQTAWNFGSICMGLSDVTAASQNIDSSTPDEDIKTSWDATRFSLAKGYGSIAIGNNCLSLGKFSMAIGNGCAAMLDDAFAGGVGCLAGGKHSFSFGLECQSTASRSVSFGYECQSTQDGAFSAGRNNVAGAKFSAAFGRGMTSAIEGQMVCGKYGVSTTDEMFVVGWGTSNSHKNVFAVGSDYIKIGSTQLTEAQLQSLIAMIPTT